jgi:hypothetical protein
MDAIMSGDISSRIASMSFASGPIMKNFTYFPKKRFARAIIR